MREVVQKETAWTSQWTRLALCLPVQRSWAKAICRRLALLLTSTAPARDAPSSRKEDAGMVRIAPIATLITRHEHVREGEGVKSTSMWINHSLLK
jgi:hypothetical protein